MGWVPRTARERWPACPTRLAQPEGFHCGLPAHHVGGCGGHPSERDPRRRARRAGRPRGAVVPGAAASQCCSSGRDFASVLPFCCRRHYRERRNRSSRWFEMPALRALSPSAWTRCTSPVDVAALGQGHIQQTPRVRHWRVHALRTRVRFGACGLLRTAAVFLCRQGPRGVHDAHTRRCVTAHRRPDSSNVSVRQPAE
jgi:hypothetical protein